MEFKELHGQDVPLLICNVWDAISARKAEKLNFQAIGTSSAAIASMLGYKDGEQMKFSELEYIVDRIAGATKLPLSVDIEAGYSRDAGEIADHIKRLAAKGVKGVNMEDSIVNGDRVILKAKAFADKIKEVRSNLGKDGVEMFLNIRTDTFLLNLPDAIDKTLERIRLYEAAGADGIFIPCIEKELDIKVAVQNTNLPVNVMCMPGLPDFKKLKELGVRRISMGNFIFENIYGHFEKTLQSVVDRGAFNTVF